MRTRRKSCRGCCCAPSLSGLALTFSQVEDFPPLFFTIPALFSLCSCKHAPFRARSCKLQGVGVCDIALHPHPPDESLPWGLTGPPNLVNTVLKAEDVIASGFSETNTRKQ